MKFFRLRFYGDQVLEKQNHIQWVQLAVDAQSAFSYLFECFLWALLGANEINPGLAETFPFSTPGQGIICSRGPSVQLIHPVNNDERMANLKAECSSIK